MFRVLAGLWEPASGVVTRPDVQRSDDDDDDDDSRDASEEEEEEGGTETTSSAASRPFQVFYVPQKPYLVSGSLRDQVMYPRAGSSDFDDEIIEALSRVNLLKLVNAHGLDRVPHDWADVLFRRGEAKGRARASVLPQAVLRGVRRGDVGDQPGRGRELLRPPRDVGDLTRV